MTSSEPDEIGSEQRGRTITLSESDVEDAARLLRLIMGEESALEAGGRGPAPGEAGGEGRQLLVAAAERIISNRQRRSDFFNRAMFSEAAWDILVLLYVTELAGTRQTQATLSKRLATPPTTIQRWVDYLEKEHLVRRDAHPTDRRTAFVSLMDKGRKALEDYLTAITE